MRARALWLQGAIALAVPRVAMACAVCAGGNPANRFAFFASTITLSLLPLGLLAGAFLWLKSRLLRRDPDEFVERDDRDSLLSAPDAPPAEARSPGGSGPGAAPAPRG